MTKAQVLTISNMKTRWEKKAKSISNTDVKCHQEEKKKSDKLLSVLKSPKQMFRKKRRLKRGNIMYGCV